MATRQNARNTPTEPAVEALSTSSGPEALGLRRKPAQSRGQASFERILATAARLIEEGGIERLNTNLVAAESGTNISSVYKYFPNKHAMLATLFERHNEARATAALAELRNLPEAADWRAVLDRATDRLVHLRRKASGGQALRLAMRASPELNQLEVQASQRAAAAFAELLIKRGSISPARAKTMARVLVELEAAMLDWWESPDGKHNPMIVRELKQLVHAYLAPYLEAPVEKK